MTHELPTPPEGIPSIVGYQIDVDANLAMLKELLIRKSVAQHIRSRFQAEDGDIDIAALEDPRGAYDTNLPWLHRRLGEALTIEYQEQLLLSGVTGEEVERELAELFFYWTEELASLRVQRIGDG